MSKLVSSLSGWVVLPLVFLGGNVASACTLDGREGFILGANQTLTVSEDPVNDVTEAQFLAAIDKVRKIYTPVFAKKGQKLEIIPKWNDKTVNAFARRIGDVAEVQMFGGLAQHEKMTIDGFMLVICHETGHHLAGAPMSTLGNIAGYGIPRWMANEGQSDYFATTKCAREVWKDEDNAAIVEKMNVPSVVTERCQKGFDKSEDINLCKRSAMAGLALANTLGSMNDLPTSSFETPDPQIAKYTKSSHPQAQCRLDTYFAGAVCGASKDVAFTNNDPTIGACAQEKGAVLGVRPLCWYTLFDPAAPASKWPQISRNGIPNPNGKQEAMN